MAKPPKNKEVDRSGALPDLSDLQPAPGAAADPVQAASELVALATQANDSFQYDKALELLGSAADLARLRNPDVSVSALLNSLHTQTGRALASQGHHEGALKEYELALRHCDDPSQLESRADTLMQIGQLLSKRGEYDRALGNLQRALGASRRLNDAVRTCKVLRNIGVVYVELGELEEAQSTYYEAIRVARESGNPTVLADLVNNLGTIQNMRGQWQEALRLYEESLGLYEAVGEKRKKAYCENNIGITYSERGHCENAAGHFERALQTAEEIRDASLVLIVNLNLADLKLKLGDVAKAHSHAECALRQLESTNARNSQYVEALKISALVDLAESRRDEAGDGLTKAIELARSIGAQFQEAEVLLERGRVHAAFGKHQEALGDLEASYRLYSQAGAEGKRAQTESAIDNIEQLYLTIFEQMAVKVEVKDEYTKGHSDRVAAYALVLARELRLQTSELKTVVASALLHDAGKIKISDAVLKKDGKLTDEEFAEMKKHPELSVELLGDRTFPWDVRPLILAHHERLDGRGYPYGLKGDEIPRGARLISVVDVFDALTSDRVYRKAFTVEKALDIMAGDSGKAFDPEILTAFTAMAREGRLDTIVNARTSEDEMYTIWSGCMTGKKAQAAEPEGSIPVVTAKHAAA